MQNRAMPIDHSRTILVLGLLLVIASAATQPYWQMAWGAALTGQPAQDTQLPDSWPGCLGTFQTIGELVAVVLLAGAAKANQGLGGVGLALVIGLWAIFLIGHTAQLNTLLTTLARTQPANTTEGGLGGGGGGGVK